jgi:formate dehydrogenase subunit gamma
MLMFPFYGGLTVGGMELAQIFHAIVGVLFVALIIGHIYIGTLGMEGAFESMSEGTVDYNWAKEHHPLWVNEENARTGPKETQRQAAATPAE